MTSVKVGRLRVDYLALAQFRNEFPRDTQEDSRPIAMPPFVALLGEEIDQQITFLSFRTPTY